MLNYCSADQLIEKMGSYRTALKQNLKHCNVLVQGRCEQLEKQVEWVKSERDEAQKVAEASAARVKELETAASRQKGHRKDDSKKAAKESKAALHKAEV